MLGGREAAAWYHRHGGAVIVYGPGYVAPYPAYPYPAYPYYAYPPPVYGVPAPAYVAPPAYVSPPPTYMTPPASSSAPPPGANSQCREYQTTIDVGGQPQQAVGVSCLQPDGSWRIIQGPAPR